MTDNNHPITPPFYLPPFYLAKKWQFDYYKAKVKDGSLISYVADQAAQWGYEQRGAVNEAELQKARDEELEACIDFVRRGPWCSEKLRAVRRPKPKSQVEEALDLLDRIEYNHMTKNLGNEKAWDIKELEAVRAALERLRELEKSNG